MSNDTGEDLERLETERANPRSKDLDQLDAEELLRVINAEDAGIADAVATAIPVIATVVERAAAAIRGDGHIHYFGAGTSGRLGVLDASEMPPTFGVSPDLVQGHIAGGDRALRSSVEGAEDDEHDGADEVDRAGIRTPDVVVAVSASGRAPWCLGVLRRARHLGAFTVAVTCNNASLLHSVADVTIVVPVGPEVLTGSTRMKAGTAQKLVLNMISTGALVRSGHTYGNLMVGLTPTNAKLRDRARRLVARITGTDDPDAALEACDGNVRAACISVMAGISPAEAAKRLRACDGSLRRALEQGPASPE